MCWPGDPTHRQCSWGRMSESQLGQCDHQRCTCLPRTVSTKTSSPELLRPMWTSGPSLRAIRSAWADHGGVCVDLGLFIVGEPTRSEREHARGDAIQSEEASRGRACAGPPAEVELRRSPRHQDVPVAMRPEQRCHTWGSTAG